MFVSGSTAHRFYRHNSGKSALSSRYYRGTTAVVALFGKNVCLADGAPQLTCYSRYPFVGMTFACYANTTVGSRCIHRPWDCSLHFTGITVVDRHYAVGTIEGEILQVQFSRKKMFPTDGAPQLTYYHIIPNTVSLESPSRFTQILCSRHIPRPWNC